MNSGVAVVVVGIGADGWDGLPSLSQAAIEAGEVLRGPDAVRRREHAGRPAGRAAARPGAARRRLLVLGSDGGTPVAVAALLTARGYGDSVVTVLSALGGPEESVATGTAATWTGHAEPLVITAVECRALRCTAPLPTTPGLPDGAYQNDGQLTKNEVRAVTLSRLAPVPGQLLWDIGAGAGSVGIEWMRTHPSCRAVAVEAVQERAERIARNASRLGVPHLRVIHGRAPEMFGRLAEPHAIFVGGGATTPLLLDACWAALSSGGGWWSTPSPCRARPCWPNGMPGAVASWRGSPSSAASPWAPSPAGNRACR